MRQTPFDPSLLLSDLYLVQWPQRLLAEAYVKRGLVFEAPAGKRVRRVLAPDGTLKIAVAYPAPGARPETVVRHYDDGYELHIVTLDRSVGP